MINNTTQPIIETFESIIWNDFPGAPEINMLM